MANAQSSRVLIVDTSAQFDGQKCIKAIKYIGAATSSATIKADSSSGTVVWEENATTNVFDEVEMELDSMYVTITGSAKIYIYLG